MFNELKKLLQLTKEISTSDWYLFENYTLIRVYGFEGEPYNLPVLLTPRIFALEYIR